MTGKLNLFINTLVFRGAGVEAGVEKLARIGVLAVIFKEPKSEFRLSRGRNVDPDKIQLHYEWTKKVSKGAQQRQKQSLERIVESLTNFLDADELEHTAQLIAQAVNLPDVSEADREFAHVLAGREFDEHERLQLEFWALLENFAYRRQLLAGTLSAPQVAQLLGTSRQTPHDRVQAKTLLGVMDKGSLKFPAWQFDSQGSDGVIDGLPDVLKALHMSDFAKLSWLVRPNPYLEGLTPVEVLKQGGKDKVLAEANAVGVS